MTFRSEYQSWRDELAGKKPSISGHVIATAAGVAFAIILIILERSL